METSGDSDSRIKRSVSNVKASSVGGYAVSACSVYESMCDGELSEEKGFLHS